MSHPLAKLTSQVKYKVNWNFTEESQRLVLLASPESQLEFKSFDGDSGLGSDIQEPVVTFAPLFTVLPHSDVPQANRLHSVVERTSQDGGGNSALLDSQQEQATVFLEELQSNPEISTTAFVPPRTIQSQLKFAPTTVSVNTDSEPQVSVTLTGVQNQADSSVSVHIDSDNQNTVTLSGIQTQTNTALDVESSLQPEDQEPPIDHGRQKTELGDDFALLLDLEQFLK